MPPKAERTERYVFDACALIAYLNDEVGTKVVEDLLTLAAQDWIQSAPIGTADRVVASSIKEGPGFSKKPGPSLPA